MTEFIVAIGAFLLAHVVPPMPPVRRFLIGLAGRRAYLFCYSLTSLVLIGWVIFAARRAPHVELWPPEPWQALVPLAVMPFAAWLFVAGFAEPNPLSISVRSNAEPALGPVAAITRHPVLWGFLLWGASHIPPNGDVVSVILFAFVSSLAIAGFFILDLRARHRLGPDQWRLLSRATSIMPFAALMAGRARIRSWRPLILAAAAAIALYAWFILQGHQLLIGIDPLASLR
jgi:uncharacterized membrane protein